MECNNLWLIKYRRWGHICGSIQVVGVCSRWTDDRSLIIHYSATIFVFSLMRKKPLFQFIMRAQFGLDIDVVRGELTDLNSPKITYFHTLTWWIYFYRCVDRGRFFGIWNIMMVISWVQIFSNPKIMKSLSEFK